MELLLAVYGALVSTVLAAIRLIEFRVSRERVRLDVGYSILISANPPDQTKLPIIAIGVRNLGGLPLHLNTVGLQTKKGPGFLFNQVAGMTPLPTKVEPTDGFLMAVLPEKLAESLGPRGADELYTVHCTDGAGTTYERKLTKRERQEIAKALADVRQRTLTR